MTLLLAVFLFAVGIQLVYILAIFTRTAFFRSSVPFPAPAVEAWVPDGEGAAGSPEREPPGVTVVVCAWNELPNLQTLLPLLDRQQYPRFEVLVMNDRSTDGTREWIEAAGNTFRHVRYLHIDREHNHVTPKKYALTTGIRNATHDLILLTDADCRPASDRWLAGMTAHLQTPSHEIVLGFSPYARRPGWLNRLIRYETLYTAVQYFSLALAGFPYMGVGRNLMYRRELFLRNRGFYNHIGVLGGDDDLFMNEVATSRNVAVCLYPETFTESLPKETWEAWRRQKQRHVSVGKYYRWGHKIRLGLLSLSHVLTWVLGGVVVGLAVPVLLRTGWSLPPGQPQTGWLLATVGAFFIRLLLFWAVVGRISYRLGHTVHWAAIPVLDAVLSGYYAVAGFKTLFRRRNKRMTWR